MKSRKLSNAGYFYVTIPGGRGHKSTLRVHTSYMSSPVAAKKAVCDAYHCPISAVISVQRARHAPAL